MSSRHAMSLGSCVLVGLLAGSACGGKAVVDGVAETGGGGPGGSGSGANEGGFGICATPAPEGALIACGSAPLGSGCYRDICDSSAHRWRATCAATGCSCTYGLSEVQCSCVGSNLDGFCAGIAHSCCPEPFP